MSCIKHVNLIIMFFLMVNFFKFTIIYNQSFGNISNIYDPNLNMCTPGRVPVTLLQVFSNCNMNDTKKPSTNIENENWI